MNKQTRRQYGDDHARQPIGTGKKILFTTIFGLFFIGILVLIEVGLRVAGYGYDTRPFIVPPFKDDIYITNTNWFKKYYPRKPLTPADPVPDIMAANTFSVDKADTTLRGFVVGGSTAQGYPYLRNQCFSKITELALAAGGKYEKVEILNLGLSAITSYCVRDMAVKLLPYQPDFLVIYAGHNEYYGTISTTTGGGFFSKNLYLALNEFRLFQLLFNLQNVFNPPAEYDTLMEEQLNQRRRPLNPGMDREIADNFVKNIDAIVKTFQRRNIPVIIVEPVCNLYDMPPFAGDKDGQFKDFINKYADVIKRNDPKALDSFYRTRLTQPQYDINANVRYLDALARKTLTGEVDLEDFKAAKELDAMPFRAKETLCRKLSDYCHDRSQENPHLFFIPLAERLARQNGAAAFGNDFFIDHLHFAQKGQQFLSRVLAERIAGLFHFNATEKRKVAGFYQKQALVEQTIHYLPAYRTDVYRKLRSLTGNPPYNRMLIPYQRKDVDGLTETTVNATLIDLIDRAESQKLDLAVQVAAAYVNRRGFAQGKAYLDAYLWNYPGNYRPYLILARFYKTVTRDVDKAFAAYQTAYLLSSKMKSIHDEIAAFLNEHDRADLLSEIDRYGRPIE